MSKDPTQSSALDVEFVLQKPQCVCGNPSALGVVHRPDGPCFHAPVYIVDGVSPVKAVADGDGEPEYARIYKLEAALEYALGIFKSVQEMKPDLMPNTIRGAISDFEKLLPASTQQEPSNGN